MSVVAMMSNTFSVVIEQAEEEWRLIFAGMVREYFDSNVLPPPLNLLEMPINMCMQSKMDAKRSLYHADGHRMPRWGQHYLFPVPSLRWHLPMAMASYLAASKDQGSRGIKHIIGKLDKLTPIATQLSSSFVPSNSEDAGSTLGSHASSGFSTHETLTALRHDLLTELGPVRDSSETAMASIARLSKEVANIDNKLSTMYDLFKSGTQASSSDPRLATASVPTIEKPGQHINSEQEEGTARDPQNDVTDG